MHVDELLEELKSQGVPLKEAVRQAREMLKKQEQTRLQSQADLRRRKAASPREYLCNRYGVRIG
jgi:hypothetical protein